MTEREKEKLAKLAAEAQNEDTFEKLDEMEKELNLDDKPDTNNEDDGDTPEEKKTVVEKIIEEAPAAGLRNPNDPNQI